MEHFGPPDEPTMQTMKPSPTAALLATILAARVCGAGPPSVA
ncbi:hypothetical protein BH23VER1_BH23VER1_00930 [soil metagenome]